MPSEIDRLAEQAFEAIRREVKNLTMLSAKGKLDAASARDLIQYYKLLKELQRQEDDDNAALSKLTDEELEEKARAILARRADGAGTPQEG